ncbi:MAG: DUF177 domain-containing protein [Acidobacteriota bacterium]|nr:DUF177 domain-containing protein [Acidobacteriota bacterium]
MQLDLNRIHDAETPVGRTFEPSELTSDGDPFTVAGPAELVMTVQKDDDLFQLAGRIRADLELACSRCLEPFVSHLDVPFDLRYLPHHMNVGGSGKGADGADGEDEDDEDAVEVGGDDLTTAFYKDDQIDLTQLVREQLFLVLPMKPLHREDCKGLCVNCGANRNETDCSCTIEWEDPRLAPLRKLKTDHA